MPLSRRQFLLGGLGAGAAGAAGLVVSRRPWSGAQPPGGPTGGSATEPGPGSPGSNPVVTTGAAGTLVLLTLYGGNDGLNTVIPAESGAYLGARGALAYNAGQVLPLRDGLGFHPSLAGLKQLWDAGQVAVVAGAGYPNANRSHFRSMDIWQSGVPDDDVATGWIGRWLDATGTDPLRAVSIGGGLPLAFSGQVASGAAVPVGPIRLPGTTRLASGYATLSRPTPGAPALPMRAAQSGADLLHVHHAVAELLAAAPPATAQPGTNLEGSAADPGEGAAARRGGALGEQLAQVARLIKAGSPTRVYGVSLGGFDTHANQRQTHADLLGLVDGAVSSFFADLGPAAAAHGVALVAVSEFGRRVSANASAGTDHGKAAPVLVVGPGVKGGLWGDQPSLTQLDDGDLRYTTDFRTVYATLLEQVVGVESSVALGRRFTPVPFL